MEWKLQWTQPTPSYLWTKTPHHTKSMKLDELESTITNPPVRSTIHRTGCQCMRCLRDQRTTVGKVIGMLGPPRPEHQAGCKCSLCDPVKMEVCGTCNAWRRAGTDCQWCPKARRIAGLLPPAEKVYCYIRHAELCTCSAPNVLNKGMLEACEGAAFYTLSILKSDTKPRSGLTRDDLDFLAWSTSKMAAHWARRALGQQDLL